MFNISISNLLTFPSTDANPGFNLEGVEKLKYCNVERMHVETLKASNVQKLKVLLNMLEYQDIKILKS
jgi:hypothetical protein